MKTRIAIIDGIRSPMGKMSGALKQIQADNLGAHVVRELLERTDFPADQIDEVIIGNVGQPAHAMNIARVIALKAGIPRKVPAYTVHRNCASGMESITTAATKILAGDGEVFIAGGVESMSNIPLLFKPETKDWFEALMRARSLPERLKLLLSVRPAMFKPLIGLQLGLTDITCGLNMGQTAEVLAKEFGISRKEQDAFALRSHKHAEAAIKNGIFAEEIAPIIADAAKGIIVENDEGVRFGQSMEALAKLRPYFDRKHGTVTAGNSSQITDGGAAVLLMSEEKAASLGLKPLGYLKAFAYAGLEPERMGLGPVYATARMLESTNHTLKDMQLIEINEAFAVQVLSCYKAFGSTQFAKEHLGKSKALGEINPDIVNVNGGAIALGHPVGMSGTRIATTLLKEMHRRKLKRGLATLCIGGGQGGALLLETS